MPVRRKTPRRFRNSRVGKALHHRDFRNSLPGRAINEPIIDHVSRSVLIVDDDPEFRRLARRLLAASGLSVAGESDCVRAALADAQRLKPSACLVDVELPDGDGVRLARELAAMPWHPRVVLTSIDGDITGSAEAIGAGAQAFIAKAELPNAPLALLLGGE
jgi:DNA-binding NarL/FixJ family response regulator